MIDNLVLENSLGEEILVLSSNEEFNLSAVHSLFKELTEKFINSRLTVSTMESCTSGLVASLITDTEGASAVLKGAFITYSNEAKIYQGVSSQIIGEYGVYSLETAAAMAESCRKTYNADLGIGVTGTLGNTDPLNKDSVPGEIFIGISFQGVKDTFVAKISGFASRFEWKLAAAKAVGIVLKNKLGSALK